MSWKDLRETLSLAAPIVAAQLAQMSMSFVDTVMVGRLGGSQLAAAALGGSLFYPVTIVCLGILAAVSPMVSQAHGARRPQLVERSVRQGLWLAGMLGIVAFLLLHRPSWFLAAVGLDAETTALSRSYLQAISWGTPALLWFGVLRNFVEGLSRPRVVTAITVAGVALNVAANYVLMYGKMGFPALGLRGCGLASSLVFWTMAALLASFVTWQRDLKKYRFFARLGRPDWGVFREMFRIGWPIGVSQGLESGIFATTAVLMGWLGVAVLAAHQIAIICAAYAFMVPVGISIAASVRVGQAVGRRDPVAAKRAGYSGIALGAVFMSLTAIPFWTLPFPIISLFLDPRLPENADVVAIAARLLAAAAVFQVFDGIQVTAMGSLRGLKDTRFPMFIALLSYWVVGLGAGCCFAFPLGLGGVGLWWGLALGLAVAAALLTMRFRNRLNRLRPRIEAPV